MSYYLSYHMFKDLSECPLRYYWRYVAKRPPTVEDIPQNKIQGIIWNKVLETFYKDRKYLLREKVREWLREEIEKVFSQQESELRVKWKAGEREEFFQESIGAVVILVEAIKKHRLLSNDVEVELSLKASVSPMCVIGGRLDMVYTREGNPCILDFKGTRHRDKRYICEDQLYWYYLLYKGARGIAPSQLGFWLLRFGEIDWVEASSPKIEEFLSRVRGAFKDLQQKIPSSRNREPPLDLGTPSLKVCAWCQYREGCGPRNKFEETRPKKDRKPGLLEEEDGLSEFIALQV